MGQKPETMAPVSYPKGSGGLILPPLKDREVVSKKLIGVDIYVEWRGADRAVGSDALADIARQSLVEGLDLSIISNRGTKVWPDGQAETFCAPLWTLRFKSSGVSDVMNAQVTKLLDNLYASGLPFVKVEKLYDFDNGKPGYTKAQGE